MRLKNKVAVDGGLHDTGIYGLMKSKMALFNTQKQLFSIEYLRLIF